ncbi:hypothetical protein Egran_00241 [Elaphomyces granulatus]|uniref:Uncharacterized protein n=1 Tax=Elaphomyces granulatus TaxID=519963 RepID=A0A232M6P6_9EURO|nr:hypothetical protein Egran_00241 [Elaphomyces granulatus]
MPGQTLVVGRNGTLNEPQFKEKRANSNLGDGESGDLSSC